MEVKSMKKKKALPRTLYVIGMIPVLAVPTLAAELPDIIPYQDYKEENTLSLYLEEVEEDSSTEEAVSIEDCYIYADTSVAGIPIAVLEKYSLATIEKTEGDVCLITSGEYKGYVIANQLAKGEMAEQLKKEHGEKYGLITAQMQSVYETSTLSGTILDLLVYGDIVEVVKKEEDSFLVKKDTIYPGYIPKNSMEYIYILPEAKPCDFADYYEENPNCLPSYSGTTGEELCEYAMQFLGNPYVWGGNDLYNGIDCSGFTQQIFEQAGYYLPRTSKEQMEYGTLLCEGYDLTLVQPGDLIFYEGHVGIYIGNGNIIHAKGKEYGICISPISYNNVLCCRRILEDSITYTYADAEINTLEKIVEAEAGNQGLKGKILVAQIILNRVNSSQFPNTIQSVVYAKGKGGYQFQPVANGKIYTVVPTEETKQAVNLALNNEDISQGALYFMNPLYADPKNREWFETKLEYLFSYRDHSFYK